ncbi:MAG TPA: F0F1 ATP synthase subunit B [Candidatus Deferrimicrobium sp.]|nr:F0F1 ATP synthase subunit B [Candidatus Deferrimicrobium sp.]
MPSLALAQGASQQLVRLAAEGGESGGLTINLFWIVVAATNFIVFFYIAYKLVLVPVGERLADRRDRIEQGLKDADAARRDREAAADQRAAVLAEARREASDIVARAQKLTDELREKGVAETQVEIERLRANALADIDAERLRALADVRGQVADLALLAAGKVVGETMSADREKRLVDEFLAQVSVPTPSRSERN